MTPELTERELEVLKWFAQGLLEGEQDPELAPRKRLSPQHRRVLACFKASPCGEASHDALAIAATGHGREPLTNDAISGVISKLKRRHPEYRDRIERIWGWGYRLKGE